MYERLLVPLDGSPAAESALPHAALLAYTVGAARVTLFMAVEGGTTDVLHIAEGYLRDQGRRLQEAWHQRAHPSPEVKPVAVCKAEGPEVHSIAARSREGQVASAILRFAEDNSVDLIVMATHGASGVDRWLMGSVAEKVLRGADVPVYLARVNAAGVAAPPALRRLLVPLDGSKLAERALPHAEHLARCAGAEVTLLFVQRPEEGRGADGSAMPSYLDAVAAGLRGAGVRAQVRVREGHPAQEIAQEADEGAADLVVMSSHGRGGLARWVFGSVADQVLRTSPTPVLLVPAAVHGPVPEHLRGPLVRRCYNCGRRTYLDVVTCQDRCSRCRYLLKACGNCEHFDGVGCLLRLPYASDVHPGNRCPQFRFRKTPAVLR